MNSLSGSASAKDGDPSSSSTTVDGPTIAAFTPSSSTTSSKQRSAILVHQKTPLLIATPPQITRALAYSHPFLLPLNKVAGLFTWTTGDPWESFLLVCSFWGITLYADIFIRWLTPLLIVSILVLAMYSRRYSPLSSTGWSRDWDLTSSGAQRTNPNTKVRHHKSLDDIVETLNLFTSRCNILLEPLLRLTDFLSTQRTATSATTRPALITLFIRLVLITPFWFILTLPPLYLITSRRVILVLGTIGLTWHSRPARISRTLLWRSRTIRRGLSLITGLELTPPDPDRNNSLSSTTKAMRDANALAAKLSTRRKPRAKSGNSPTSPGKTEGIRFTFSLFENQRRWIGLGWTTTMFGPERTAWTDEELVSSLPKEQFSLPVIDGGIGTWRWCEGSEWTVEGPAPLDDSIAKADAADLGGWIYYDTQWRYPKRQDGWGRYTRRRKWVRDAELVELDLVEDHAVDPSSQRPRATTTATMTNLTTPDRNRDGTQQGTPGKLQRQQSYDAASLLSSSATRRKTWFGRPSKDVVGSTSTSPVKASPLAQMDKTRDKDAATTVGNVSISPSRTKATSNTTTSKKSRHRASTSASTSASWESTSKLSSGGRSTEDYPREAGEDGYVPLQFRGRLHGVVGAGWGVGEDLGMELG